MTATDAMPTVDATISALADPVRRSVIDLLAHEPHRPSDIADTLSLTRPATSRHLRVLRHAGLVENVTDHEDARVRFYRLRPEPFGHLRGWLDEVEGFWTDQLTAFKAHAEKRRR